MLEKERPDSPCIAVCSTALGDEICRGCGRSVVEVSTWVMMSDEDKNKIWARLEEQWRQGGKVAPWLREE
ncbi:DUF1289 domain-containing protein [Iodobacter fluviatilis]|uniref:Predicted Fe-S protein n=1 Tax=Iodobacter fluviatilis TaxID=537 RepID=A0A377SV56_9NEIS|nr:DUF1289 domain-containing protein [Iodobacter fluviatilis]TCU85108.1 hypothetical protein EV682_108136 [Iodobacter fluviatilis]STR45208.1 Predicted Fe-S protein [Iodobacter fluviatilis]